ncbi:M48 family metalloprotease [Phormidium sp. FACHB-322]|uniref:M48 family metallopeptidase n=2 Tax=Cyanobacteriota TaxID=1117 RepID=UPI001682BEE3|nr:MULTISPECIES: M48 family metallopeptidase [Cyanophyceae]MBD1916816.1 M48 family metalloprotease [Phormidium sp. FACHB-77]MBD2029446.1 M48 family metalloprotease [Phormidium sp. FACHB-322]MBD2052022.1 M48 family metalloprotease [Leptolyngbya sp. FACHB-60]
MLSPLTQLTKNSFLRRGLYGLLAAVMAITIGLSTPTASQASIFDLIFQGIRYVQLGNLSDRDEVNLGSQIDRQVKAQGVRVYNRNATINSYINDIGQRLAASSDRPNLPYTFQVVDDEGVNAFATTGGFVYIQTGLIKAAANEAELAGVMAHEIGHITGRHAINQMRQRALASGVAGALEVRQDALVGLGVQLALQLPNSREAEYDADRRGFHNMGRAGYDTSGFISFMQKLEGGSNAEFLSTHPNPGNRVSNLQSMNSAGTYSNAGAGTDANAYRSRIRGL